MTCAETGCAGGMDVTRDTGALIDLIHGAIHGDASWHEFLDAARGLVPNGHAMLLFHDAAAETGAIGLAAGGDTSMAAAYRDHFSKINPWMPHASVRPLGRVMQADEMLPRKALRTTEFYNDYLRPQEIETGFGVTIRRDGGCNYNFTVLCADPDEGALETAKTAFQALVPHLREAFEHHRRQPEEMFITPDGAAHDRLPRRRGLVRVGPGCRVLFADTYAQWLADRSGSLSIGAFGRFSSKSQALTDYVENQLATWDGGASLPSMRIFHLRRETGALPLRVTVFRPGGSGVVFFRGPECILQIEDPADGFPAAVEEFVELFGLSPAERRIVEGLANGLALDAIAAESGLSVATLRTQLKHIFSKTGLNRQSGIVRYISIMAGALRGG